MFFPARSNGHSSESLRRLIHLVYDDDLTPYQLDEVLRRRDILFSQLDQNPGVFNEDGSFEFPFELQPEGGAMKEFKKGDRVVVVKPPLTTIKEGACGTVLYDEDSWGEYGVALDEAFDGGHNLAGACESGHGYWFWPEQLEPADIAPSIDEEAFDALLFG